MPHNLASVIRPVYPPQILDDVYTDDQQRRLFDLIRRNGPWRLILAQHFNQPEEVVAAMSGVVPEGATLTWDMFLSPNFRGYLAEYGAVLYPDIEDCFLNRKFLDLARGYWQAEHARPDSMLFNISGPTGSADPGHIDATRFRGVTQRNAPGWLLNTMGKSGLFNRWRAKVAQINTWFYRGRIGGGFTYWPDGLHGNPQRIAAPMWNRAALAENEMMFHRAEPNGPEDQRKPDGLAMESTLSADPHVPDGWQITTNGQITQSIPAEELRLLVVWTAEIFTDRADLKMTMEGKDDLSLDQVFETFAKDLRARGRAVVVPGDPLHDHAFITLLNQSYDLGTPARYPAEAPGPASY